METEEIKNSMIKWARNFGRPIQLKEWEEIWLKRLRFTGKLVKNAPLLVYDPPKK